MIKPEIFYKNLKSEGVDFFTGVPDSLLADFCAYLTNIVEPTNHIIASNEGNAVALGVGYHLATDKIPLVYLQNSGLGNIVNPILSIADDKVYAIPMIILIGWRGEPGVKDEPQHIRQGEVNEDMLKAMKLPYLILDSESDPVYVVKKAVSTSIKESKPFVILTRKDTFSKFQINDQYPTAYELSREDVIKMILDELYEKDIVVSTTGKTSREVFEYREKLGHSHEKDFLTVGGMGHTSSIALGIAIGNRNRNVYCIDGDGSLIMHMGSLAINGSLKGLDNFKHIVINNGAHDSVGGQPTVGFEIDMVGIAKSCGYSYSKSVDKKEEIYLALKEISNYKGFVFLEIRVNKGARENLGRPTTTPLVNKIEFKKFLLGESDNI